MLDSSSQSSRSALRARCVRARDGCDRPDRRTGLRQKVARGSHRRRQGYHSRTEEPGGGRLSRQRGRRRSDRANRANARARAMALQQRQELGIRFGHSRFREYGGPAPRATRPDHRGERGARVCSRRTGRHLSTTQTVSARPPSKPLVRLHGWSARRERNRQRTGSRPWGYALFRSFRQPVRTRRRVAEWRARSYGWRSEQLQDVAYAQVGCRPLSRRHVQPIELRRGGQGRNLADAPSRSVLLVPVRSSRRIRLARARRHRASPDAGWNAAGCEPYRQRYRRARNSYAVSRAISRQVFEATGRNRRRNARALRCASMEFRRRYPRHAGGGEGRQTSVEADVSPRLAESCSSTIGSSAWRAP